MSITMAPVEETLHRALNYKAEGLYDEAIELFRICLTRDPGNGVAHMELGLVYGFVGLFDESIEELESAVDLAPEQLDCRLTLAKTYSMLGLVDEARRQFEHVLQRDPFNGDAIEQLEYLM